MSIDFKQRLLEQFSRITKALSSGNRLHLLELLAQGERSVETLASLAGMSVANTSRHLQQLRQAGLVRSRKDGLYVRYQIAGGGVVRLLHALGEVAQNNLAEVSQLIDEFLTARDALEPVAHQELMQRARKGLVTVIDVRPPEEFAAGHIAGALNVPLGDLVKWVRRAPKGKEIIAYCRGPYCLMAFEAVALLRDKGLKARRLNDGYPEWRSAGLPIETGGG
jgi:rhodanese-related sulfurtransferase/DNA-binding transcriptional ArsR family regulator